MRKLIFIFSFITLFFTSNIWAQSVPDNIRIYSIFVTRGSDNISISWRTEPITKSKLEYADVSGRWQETPWADTFTEQHSLTLLNLLADSSYLYRISAEDEHGTLKTKTGSFTTLSSELYGTTTDTETDNGGFKTLLTPYLTPSLTPTPTIMNPTVLGTQNFAYIPMPIMMPYTYAYQPQGQLLTDNQPTTEPTPIPITISPVTTSGLNEFDTTSLTLVIGLVLGVVASFFIFQLTHGKIVPVVITPQPHQNDTQSNNTEPINSLPNTFSFSVKGKE